jgi:hypothetical protein
MDFVEFLNTASDTVKAVTGLLAVFTAFIAEINKFFDDDDTDDDTRKG